MKITAISPQIRDDHRVNISIDGRFQFSLDIAQIIDIGLKVGQDVDDERLSFLKAESEYGKVYGRALEYCLVRPRSKREVKDYLYKKTKPRIGKDGKKRLGISVDLIPRIIDRLIDRGYIDDYGFAKYWVENRFVKKGVSRRKLFFELKSKGVDDYIVEQVLGESSRNDNEELAKIIAKKRNRYPDNQKLMAYLSGLGFGYDDIKQALGEEADFI